MKKERFIIGILLFFTIAVCLIPRFARAEENLVSLLTSYTAIDGDWKRFRENLWMDRHFVGGIESLLLERDLGDGKHVTMEGRALSDNDYSFSLNLEKEEFGYMNLSYDEFRKYYDDSGEYHQFPRPTVVPSYYELNKDLHTDRSTFSLDFGLTLPEKPKYTLGFERKTKRGEMALGLGAVRDTRGDGVATNDDLKYVYPWSRDIDWVVDTLKAGTEFKLKGFNIVLNQRFQTYDNSWFTNDVYELRDNSFPPYNRLVIEEKPSYKSSTTTFLADNQVNDKLFMKSGYLFSALKGRSEWERNYYQPSGALRGRYYNGEADSDFNSNILTWGANFKPLNNLFLTGRLRYENTKTSVSSEYTRDGTSYSPTTTPPNPVYDGVIDFIQRGDSDVDKSSFGESLGLEYKGLVRTSLYMDMEWEQSEVKYLETAGGITGSASPTTYWRDDHVDFNKDTYTLGVNTRPIKPLFISGRYRRINKVSDFTPYTDTITGYPGWIGDNSRKTDEYTIRTEIKPNKFAAFSIKYQNSQTNYDLSKEPGDGIATFDTQTTSLGVTLTPTAKLYINTLYSFQDAMLRTKAEDEAVKTEYYNGDSNSFITTTSYALNEKTSLSGQYQRWAADEEDGISQGLSLGLERSLKENLSLKVGYAYYTYDNNEQAGIDDYKANIVYTSITGKF